MLQESCKGISRVNVLKRKFQTYFKQVLRLSKGSFTSVSSKSKGCLIREVSRCLVGCWPGPRSMDFDWNAWRKLSFEGVVWVVAGPQNHGL